MFRSLCFISLCLALLPVLTARADDEARRFEPCIDGYVPHWTHLDLIGDTQAAQRDGWLLRATLAPPRPGLPVSLGVPDLRGVSLRVEASNGDVVDADSEALVIDHDYVVAWHPKAALDAQTSFTLTVELDNTARNGCPSAPVFEQTAEITTTDALTQAPPEPPLREIAFGRAWWAGPITCCEPRDKARCTDPSRCFKCWRQTRVPLIVARFDAPASTPISDELDHSMFYGASANGRLLGGWLADQPHAVFLPWQYPDLEFSDVIREACLTAATRNPRTLQIATRTRCRPLESGFVDPSTLASELAGQLLPMLSFTEPTDPTLEIGPAGCSAAPSSARKKDEPDVAASYEQERLDCERDAACLATRTPRARGDAGMPAAASVNSAGSTMSEAMQRGGAQRRHASSCSATPLSTGHPHSLLLLVPWLLGLRRKRARCRSAPTV